MWMMPLLPETLGKKNVLFIYSRKVQNNLMTLYTKIRSELLKLCGNPNLIKLNLINVICHLCLLYYTA